VRILGIDPGLGVTGYGLIDAGGERFRLVEAGVIRTYPREGIDKRLKRIHANVIALIEEHEPSVLVLEKLYAHYRHPTTALLMGHARGVVCLACGQKRVKLVSYSSTRIKKAVVGKGHASKKQIGGMVRGMLGLRSAPEPDDVADALACAISYAHIERV
jgi:crossover junction endodeoxyribonuclease RuvC